MTMAMIRTIIVYLAHLHYRSLQTRSIVITGTPIDSTLMLA